MIDGTRILRSTVPSPETTSLTPPAGAEMGRPRVTRLLDWLWALLLTTPMLATYAMHFALARAGSRATGFLQFDQPYYFANAREHFDDGRFHWLYGLPFSADYDTPRLYVQPQSLFFGFVHHLTGVWPGYLYVAFGVVAAVVCMRVATALLEQVMGQHFRTLRTLLLVFAWGGGTFAAAGALRAWVGGLDVVHAPYAVGVLFAFEPGDGYWFLNLGRNLFYATEAFYHALSLGTVLLAMRGRLWLSCLTLAVLCASHPFTGVQLALIMNAWVWVELLLRRYGRAGFAPTAAPVTRTHALAFFGVLAVHVAYYLVFLRRSPEHVVLQKQWSHGLPATWVMHWYQDLLAYGVVFALAVFRLGERNRLRAALQQVSVRLLVVWALVSIALVHHDLLIAPLQPLHFTHGYIWMPLFLLGAPALAKLLVSPPSRALGRRLLPALLVVAFLADNACWLGAQCWQAARGGWPLGYYLSREEEQVLDQLDQPHRRGSLLIGTEQQLNYLAMTYTPLRAWTSHEHNTPDHKRKLRQLVQFYETGRTPSAWHDRRLISVVHRRLEPLVADRLLSLGFVKTFENGRFVMHERDR